MPVSVHACMHAQQYVQLEIQQSCKVGVLGLYACRRVLPLFAPPSLINMNYELDKKWAGNRLCFGTFGAKWHSASPDLYGILVEVLMLPQ